MVTEVLYDCECDYAYLYGGKCPSCGLERFAVPLDSPPPIMMAARLCFSMHEPSGLCREFVHVFKELPQ